MKEMQHIMTSLGSRVLWNASIKQKQMENTSYSRIILMKMTEKIQWKTLPALMFILLIVMWLKHRKQKIIQPISSSLILVSITWPTIWKLTWPITLDYFCSNCIMYLSITDMLLISKTDVCIIHITYYTYFIGQISVISKSVVRISVKCVRADIVFWIFQLLE